MTERIEVTEELLAQIDERIAEANACGSYVFVVGVAGLTALVDRIRSLEKGIREAIAEHDEQAEAWGDDETVDPEVADYHRLHGDLLRGYLA